MAKPIFLVRIQDEPEINYDNLIKTFKERLNDDYHVLVILETDFPEGIKCECFNSDKIAPIEIEELKKIINKK